MLTAEELAEIKSNYSYVEVASSGFDAVELLKDTHALFVHIDALQLALAAKDAVLSQFASSDNWQCDTPDWDESFSLWAWAGDDNPLHLAARALGEGK